MNAAAEALRRLERLAFRARPCLESIEFDGWVLRFADGYTKRANSVNPQFSSTLPVEEKLARCESEYGARGLPTVFRLTPFSQPPELDGILHASGYTLRAGTLVLSAPLDRPLPPSDVVRSVGVDAWFDTFNRLRKPASASRESHRRIVEAADGPRHHAIIERGGEPVACGLGVLVDDVVALFDLFTRKANRRCGLGSAVVGDILGWGCAHGARTALLQVHGENEPALRLYERFGFTIAYPYWYRIAPERTS
jgi:GNAT superfamily N-acetyltransferase